MSTRRLSQNQFIGFKRDLPLSFYEGATYISIDTKELYMYDENELPVLLTGTGGGGTEPTGLEALNEGSGIGFRLIGRDASRFGPIGLNAVDFSQSTGASSSRGSTGQYTLSFGQNVENNDQFSLMGGLNINDLKSGQGVTYSAANFTYGAYLNIYDNNAVNVFLGERSDIGWPSQAGDHYQVNCVFNTFHNGGGNRVRGGWGSFISGVALLTGAGASVTMGIGNKDLTQGVGAGNGTPARRFGDGTSQSNSPRLIVGAGTGVNYIHGTTGGALNTSVSNRNNALVVWGDGTATLPMQSSIRIDSPNIPELASGTADGTTASKLVDSSASFLWEQNINAGDVVKNTTDSTETTVVTVDSNTEITLANDIFVSGENYIIEPKGYEKRTIITREYLYENYSAKTQGYTVATLPSGEVGDTAYVTDASSVTWRAVATGGGSDTVMVFFDGTNWIYH